jgi:hypothetical protein
MKKKPIPFKFLPVYIEQNPTIASMTEEEWIKWIELQTNKEQD